MMLPAKQSRIARQFDKDCLICKRPASCMRYGVVSCAACKMFFRRTIIEKLTYTCRKDKKCLEQLTDRKSICRACRFEKCLELGMEYIPEVVNVLEVAIRKEEELGSLLGDLRAMDSSLYLKLMKFYTEDDPVLEDILEGKPIILLEKKSEQKINPWQWSFFATYIMVSSFMNLNFIRELSVSDKLELFRCCTTKVTFFRSAMRALRDRQNRIFTPDGQEVYPQELVNLLKVDPLVLKRICSLLATRMIELNVADEEFVLLQFIFFCDPTLESLSDDARSVLSTHQKMYTSTLFQYCQLKYQNTAPSRLTDLLSLSHVLCKFVEDLVYVAMCFQCATPNFKIQKLAIDTFNLSKNTKGSDDPGNSSAHK